MPKLNDSPTKQPSEGQLNRAAERARLNAMVESEYQPPEETAETPPDDDPPPEPEITDDAGEDEPGQIDEIIETTDPPKRRSRSEVWAAIKAQEERFNSGFTSLQQALDEKLNGFLGKLDELKPKPQPEEIDPEAEAWDAALRESVTKHVSPEIAAIREQHFLDKVELSVYAARAVHKDFDELVGDIYDPNNNLMNYLKANEDESKKVFSARNIGEALRNKALFLKEGTTEAREQWKADQLAQIKKGNEAELARMKAELMKEFKGVVAKGQNGNPIKPTSIANEANGAAGDDPSPLKTAIKNRDRRALEELVRRGEAGEDIN